MVTPGLPLGPAYSDITGHGMLNMHAVGVYRVQVTVRIA